MIRGLTGAPREGEHARTRVGTRWAREAKLFSGQLSLLQVTATHAKRVVRASETGGVQFLPRTVVKRKKVKTVERLEIAPTAAAIVVLLL